MYDSFFAKAQALTQQGMPFATATIVRAEKPTSGKPGDKAIITLDGVMHGWIGGSCAQPTVIEEALKALAEDQSRLIRLSIEPDANTPREGLTDLKMACYSGGTLEIFIEPHPPQPNLMIVGNLPVAQALAHLGIAMNYYVIAVDPAANSDQAGASMAHADEVLTSMEAAVTAIKPYTYVVVTTHGDFDELALQHILKTHPAYVGLVASEKRAEAVRQYLLGQGLSEEDLFPLKAPAGLDIQARRGDEIALSIMAEIVQKRRNTELLDFSWFQAVAAEGPAPETATDPVCGMTVTISETAYRHDHDGTTYYFCCGGCQTEFAKSPESYLKTEYS